MLELSHAALKGSGTGPCILLSTVVETLPLPTKACLDSLIHGKFEKEMDIGGFLLPPSTTRPHQPSVVTTAWQPSTAHSVDKQIGSAAVRATRHAATLQSVYVERLICLKVHPVCLHGDSTVASEGIDVNGPCSKKTLPP